MHLLHTGTAQLRSFPDGGTPLYAVLSSGDGDGDIVYQDIQRVGFNHWPDQNNLLSSEEREKCWDKLPFKNKKGFDKLKTACDIAWADGLRWLYSEVCCMDRTSRADVNEGMNFMYERLRRSDVCYAYVEGAKGPRSLSPVDFSFQDLLRSSWFTSAYYLQELLAPPEVRFFTSNPSYGFEKVGKADLTLKWIKLGSRTILAEAIAIATGISTEYLLHHEDARYEDARHAPYAERISWIAGRTAAFSESKVYAVLGLFDITLDINYGEGSKAFEHFRKAILSNCGGEVLIERQALRDSRDAICQQRGLGRQNPINDFQGFIYHDVAWIAHMEQYVLLDGIRAAAIEMAKSPAQLTGLGFRFCSICRPVRHYLIVWTHHVQIIGNIQYAVCVQVLNGVERPREDGRISVQGMLGRTFHVRTERLCGFQLCDIYLFQNTEAENFRLFLEEW